MNMMCSFYLFKGLIFFPLSKRRICWILEKNIGEGTFNGRGAHFTNRNPINCVPLVQAEDLLDSGEQNR